MKDEIITCPECDGDGYIEEETDGEEAYCELLAEFDDLYYEFNENLLKEFDILLNKWDDMENIDDSKILKDIRRDIKPRCKLSGEDGNVFNIIGKVVKVLKDNDMGDKTKEFKEKAFKQHSYDNVLTLCCEYVDVY